MSLLQQIQSSVQQVAEAISSVLDIEVTIVDDSLVRIAGTGARKNTIGQKITGQSLYQSVIQTKKEAVITDIHTAEQCITCEERSNCKQLAELCCPIFIGTEVIGVIGLIAFSPERRLELLTKNERLLEFISRMAELIAAKAAEADNLNRLLLMKNQLETVLNFIVEGVIAIDHTAKIININYAAEKMLRVKARDVIGFHINEVFPGSAIQELLRDSNGFSNREINIWQKGRQHHYIINAQPMMVGGLIKGAVASFRTIGSWADPPELLNTFSVAFDDIIGSSAKMMMAKAEARKVAETASTVLIIGESGTGKEVFARAIHSESDRGSKSFIAVNCAAIPEHLLESELFGYEEGSFTGARKGGKPGKFQLARGGTLFLDEIGDMPLSLQVKILRVLQEKVVEPVGCIMPQPVDVRIIAATNRNLEDLIAKGQFRSDLYYRLNVFLLTLPPLRDRPEDISELVNHLLQKHCSAYGKEITSLTPEAQKALIAYPWPGNIRELENTIEYAVIRATSDHIQYNDLPIKVVGKTPCCIPTVFQPESPEKQAIIEALQTYGTSVEGKQKAATHLGIGIATLYRKMKKYNL